jgi:hypothetical protein
MGDLAAGLGKEAARELLEKVQRGKVIMAAMHVWEITSQEAVGVVRAARDQMEVDLATPLVEMAVPGEV